MTLISYSTRTHFADRVLEEALWSEMAERRLKRPLLLLSDIDAAAPGVTERLQAGLPARAARDAVFHAPRFPNEDEARALAKLYAEMDCDCVVAVGGRAVIEFAKAARLAIGDGRPFAEISPHARGTEPRAPLIVAPVGAGIGAAANAFCSVRSSAGRRLLLRTRALIPDVAICDPTLDEHAAPAEAASAGAGAIVACVEPYLSSAYNPPADGIALDGLRRALESLPQVMRGGGAAARRELAAAGFNGSLALEKGPGAAYWLVDSLCAVSEAAPDPGAVARLVLPGVLRIGGGRGRDARRLTVRGMLALTSKDCLAEGVEAFMKPLPLAASLSAMGVTRGEIARAAEEASHDLALAGGERRARDIDLYEVLDGAY